MVAGDWYNAVEKSVGPNETDIVLQHYGGLTSNQKHEYTVTAVNKIGKVTSKSGIISTCEQQPTVSILNVDVTFVY